MIQIIDESKLLRTNSQVQTLLCCALESSSSSEIQSLIEMAIEKSKAINSIIENKPESYQRPKTPAIETLATCNSFAERLRLALAYSGMTQDDLAWKIGLSQGAINSYVTGKVKEAGIARAGEIAEAIGINAGWLRYGEGEMTDFCTSKTEEL
ncbi:TPA: helix-turn-helix domain-containing protein [Proteus mirabilis]|uniref:helix-turn-helix domain-containing protein n=1 Tax=Proteus terrae TaxID=1574161 RepID=UPI0029E1211A|nr:helix-turn-helix domain-containing protein [Proteus mirabilis]HEK3212194.1 helix-turn-helix domain-containing protein [Proteus mirabilis]